MRFYFTRTSRNKKTGPIPVVTASRDTCPPDCALLGNGCYAEHGPLALVWQRCFLMLNELCKLIRQLPKHQLWRYGQAGDLPPDDADLDKLVAANNRRPVLCYTHTRNVEQIRKATKNGFHINISADSLDEAEKFADQGLSTVVVLPSVYGRNRTGETWTETLSEYKTRTSTLSKRTANGTRIAVCPQTYTDVSCDDCRVCAGPRKKNAIVGFPAHGSRKAQIDRRISDVRRLSFAARPDFPVGHSALS